MNHVKNLVCLRTRSTLDFYPHDILKSWRPTATTTQIHNHLMWRPGTYNSERKTEYLAIASDLAALRHKGRWLTNPCRQGATGQCPRTGCLKTKPSSWNRWPRCQRFLVDKKPRQLPNCFSNLIFHGPTLFLQFDLQESASVLSVVACKASGHEVDVVFHVFLSNSRPTIPPEALCFQRLTLAHRQPSHIRWEHIPKSAQRPEPEKQCNRQCEIFFFCQICSRMWLRLLLPLRQPYPTKTKSSLDHFSSVTLRFWSCSLASVSQHITIPNAIGLKYWILK